MNKFSTRIFYLFASAHLLLWTIVPILMRYTLPLDTLEGAMWGRQLALGYDKNPWMNAWLTELAVRLGGQSGWLTYLFSQISVIIAFFAIWRLARKIVAPAHAFIAVVLLEFISVFNFDAIDFNDNVLEIGLWALLILFFYRAVKNQKTRDWLLVGLWAGLAMMTKYLVWVLLLPMFIFVLLDKDARATFTKPAPYFGALVFVLICAPHFVWLFFHDFITLRYVFVQTDGVHWFGLKYINVFYHFVRNVLASSIAPFAIALWLKLSKEKGSEIISEPKAISKSDQLFLLLIGLGPLCVILLYALITGAKLFGGWRTPLFLLWGLLLVAYLRPTITRKKLYQLIILLFIFMIGAASGYAWHIYHKDKYNANYPGPTMAKQLTSNWHAKYHTPLKYVAGTRYEVSVISLYSKDRPAAYVDADPEISFWVNKNDLRKNGALVVWGIGEEQCRNPYQKSLGPLVDIHKKAIYSMKGRNVPPIKICVAFLPPKKFKNK